jgi:hypothetical protein
MPRRLAPVLRWVLWAVAGSLVALAVLLLAGSAYLATEHGRSLLLRAVVTELNRTSPGTFSARELEHVSLTKVALRGLRLRARAGNDVLTVETLHARIAPASLLLGRLAVLELKLEDAMVDVRFSGDPERALLPALVERQAEPRSPGARAPLDIDIDIDIEELRLERWRVLLPSAAPVDELRLSTKARFIVGAELRLMVEELRARSWRQGRDIGEVSARGRWASSGIARLELGAAVSGMKLDVDLQLGEAGQGSSSWRRSPFVLALHARELTAERLASLTAARLPSRTLLGSYAVRLELRGVPESFTARGTLQTPAGSVTLTGAGRDLAELQLSLRTESVALRRLSASLPDRSVAGDLVATLERAPGRPFLRSLALMATPRTEGVTLPRLTFRAQREIGSSWQLELGLDDGGMALWAEGQATPEGRIHATARGWLEAKHGIVLALALDRPNWLGTPRATGKISGRLVLSGELWRKTAGALDVRAQLRSPRLELGDSRMDRLAAVLSLAKDGVRTRLRGDARWRAAARGSLETTPGRLRLEGGSQRVDFDLRSGTFGFGSLSAAGKLRRMPGEHRLELSATGQIGAAPWRLSFPEARRVDTGELVLPSAELELCGQRLRLHGRYAGADSRFALQLADGNLSRLRPPCQPPRGLTGTLRGRAELRGELRSPELSLTLRAHGYGTERGPQLDASVDSLFDAKRGSIELRASARERTRGSRGPRLDVTLSASSRFEPLRPWRQSLLGGDHRARLEIERLDSALFGELFGGLGFPGPVSFDGGGFVELRVQQGVPALDHRVEGHLRWLVEANETAAERSGSARLKHALLFDAGRFETVLEMFDGDGARATLHGSVALFAGGSPTLAELEHTPWADWKRRLRASSWQIDLDAERIALDRFPMARWLGKPTGTTMDLRLAVGQTPVTSPRGSVAFRVDGSAERSSRGGCSSRLLTTRGRLALDADRFELDISAFDGDERRLHLATEAELDVEAWLSGRAPPAPAFDVAIEAAELPLERLPWVCENLRGRVTGSATVRDPLGTPQARADLEVARFSLGSDETVDATGRVLLDGTRLELSGAVLARGRRSSFDIKAARAAEGGGSGALPTLREVTLELSALPLAPLLPLRGPISHASGAISGVVRASGRDGSPRVSGNLRLDGVAFTVTALAQAIEDIQGEIQLSDDGLKLKGLSARDGDGELHLEGTLKLDPARGLAGTLSLVARDFPVRRAGEIAARTSAKAHLQASWGGERNRLRVVVAELDSWLEGRKPSRAISLEPHPDLILKRRDRSLPALPRGAARADPTRAAPTHMRVPLLVEIDAERPFWVKREDFALQVSADLAISIDPSKKGAAGGGVDMRGLLRFERGYMELLGKSFEIHSGGTLRFTGGTSALLDVVAQYEDRRTNDLVIVHLQGSMQSPKLEFQVDGQKVTAGEAFQAIYGSSPSSDDGVDPEARANQVIGSLLAGLVSARMRRRLGAMAPILSVDSADDDRGDQVRAGFALDTLIPDFLRPIITGIYLEGSISSDRQGATGGDDDLRPGVLIELYFPHDLVSSGRYGPDATWSLDLGWQPLPD